jgi:hypothetical protein
MSRKILSPQILQDRIAYMEAKSVWYYVEILNGGLRMNQVEQDGIINITVKYKLDSDLIYQLVSLYENTGWKEVNAEVSTTTGGLYGSTTFQFVPPVVKFSEIKRMVDALLSPEGKC